ncbi:DUF2190 family protein [Ensifer adhaerens]|uniref:DUF2190 family protein n=1 Tax=Ensifer adhaerens TaxID=106592 RepID=UPI001CBC46D7|nr:capsid cement protein [Ensifer adhaerens]MBZ7921651.1 DUF2190 family protein [Ensifer adhaerens]UAX94066.1 DUF2190 family protein [Ensifer adhaerens]UAY01700.1 DUF2190 family protein [Ensifer adhaerens]UAY09084.1 DUF2190 family protein [Ensifer adhaerens]
MKNYIGPGTRLALTVADTSAAVDIASGDGYVVGSIFGVAVSDVAVGEEGIFETEGVFELAKVSAQAWTVGQKIYWSASLGQATTSSSGNTLIGVAVAVAANPSAKGRVRLNGSF